MLAEFSIIPVGKNKNISIQVAKILKIVDASKLPYKVNPVTPLLAFACCRVLPLRLPVGRQELGQRHAKKQGGLLME